MENKQESNWSDVLKKRLADSKKGKTKRKHKSLFISR